MLSFDSALSNALKLGNTTAFWVLKLYYNAEGSGDFIGVSDTHRVDGSDIYYGLVSSWGNYSQSLDFFNFTTSTGNMSVRLINTDKSIQGGRFSDLFSTNNFANRKWELFLNTSQAGTYDTAVRMIGTGIISGNIKYDTNSVSLSLLDFDSKYHQELPTTVVVSSTYSNAPEKNINKPIPMFYGDCHDKDSSSIGTIPTSGAQFDRYYTKGKFPAIITDKFDSTNANIEALVDNETPHTLDTENIYMKVDDNFAVCLNTTQSGNKITVSDVDWRVYITPTHHNTYSSGTNYGQTVNRDFRISAPYTLSASDGTGTTGWRIPKIPKLGEFTDIKVLIALRDMATDPGSTINAFFISKADGTSIADLSGSWSDGNDADVTSSSIAGLYSSPEKDSWDFENSFLLKLTDASGDSSVKIAEIALEIQFEPSQIFEKIISEPHEVTIAYSEFYTSTINEDGEQVPSTRRLNRTRSVQTPVISDYIYFSGKGRKYPAFIDADSRNQGYNETDLIENPVYIIEDVLRTELSLTSSEIDYASFDTSGNTTDGYLGDIYDDAVGDVKFAFSQYKFINSKDFISRICKQILSWVFISGDGKFKIKTLRRVGDYDSADKTIDFNDINLKSISKTSLGGVRNDITVNYNFDYGEDQFLSNANPTADSTSKGTTVNGYNVSDGLKLEIDADVLDDDTAGATSGKGLADAYMTIFKDRKVILDFDCIRPLYNDLEIGDIITFDNWDTNLKLYGTAFSSDYFIVQDIAKRPEGCSIKSIKVDA